MTDFHKRIVQASKKLSEGLVYCYECGLVLRVDSAKCLQYGWPVHCGSTMSIDKPITNLFEHRQKKKVIHE